MDWFQGHCMSCLSGVKFGLAATAELIINEIMRNVVNHTDNFNIKDCFLQLEETKWSRVLDVNKG